MHTSIIYVTKKVIHWGANHPTVLDKLAYKLIEIKAYY